MPLVLDTDVLRLSPSLFIKHGHLYDGTVGAIHHIQPPGKLIVSMLTNGAPYSMLQETAEQAGISPLQLNETIAFLNSFGALDRQRCLRSHGRAWHNHALAFIHGIRYGPFAWRRPASYHAMLVGVCRAAWPVAVAAIVTGLLISQAGPGPLRMIGLPLFAGTTLFGVSVYIHECAHVYAIRQYGKRVDILQSGRRIGLLHSRLHPSGELYSALIGPTIGSIVGIASSLYLLSIGWRPLAWVALLVAVTHVAGLLPWYGDGASILRSWRHRKVNS